MNLLYIRLLFFHYFTICALKAGKGHRNSGDGENIAWDLSGDGSPAKESVMRWYSEIFYYNRKHPTHALPNKPVGKTHLI